MEPITEYITIYKRTEDNKKWKMKIWAFHTPISEKQSVISVQFVLEIDLVSRLSWKVNLIWPNDYHGFNQFIKKFGCKALLTKLVLSEMNEKDSQAIVNNVAGVKENESVQDMIDRFAAEMQARAIIILDDIFFLSFCPIHDEDPTTLEPDLKPFRWFANFIEKRIQKHKLTLIERFDQECLIYTNNDF